MCADEASPVDHGGVEDDVAAHALHPDITIPIHLSRDQALTYINGLFGQGYLLPSRKNDQGLDIDSMQLWLHGYSQKTFDTYETNNLWQNRALWGYERKACYRFGLACSSISRQYLAQAKSKACQDSGMDDLASMSTTKLLVGLLGWWNLVKYLPMTAITFHEEGEGEGEEGGGAGSSSGSALNQETLSLGLHDVELDLQVPSWLEFLKRDCKAWDYVHIISEYVGIPESYQDNDQGLQAWLCGYSNIRVDQDLIRFNTQDWVGGYLARFHPDLSEFKLSQLEGAEKRAASRLQLEQRSAIRKELLASGEYAGPQFAKKLSIKAFYVLGGIKDICFRDGMKQGKVNMSFELFFRFICTSGEMDLDPKDIKKFHQQFRLDYHPDKFFHRADDVIAEKLGKLQHAVTVLRDHNYKVKGEIFDGEEIEDLTDPSALEGEGKAAVRRCVANVFSMVETVWQAYSTVVGDRNSQAKMEEYIESATVGKAAA